MFVKACYYDVAILHFFGNNCCFLQNRGYGCWCAPCSHSYKAFAQQAYQLKYFHFFFLFPGFKMAVYKKFILCLKRISKNTICY